MPTMHQGQSPTSLTLSWSTKSARTGSLQLALRAVDFLTLLTCIL